MLESRPNVALFQLLQERVRHVVLLLLLALRICTQGCQMARFDPFLCLDCARVEGVGAQSKERKGSNLAAQRSRAIVLLALRAKHIRSKNMAFAIWQPWSAPSFWSFWGKFEVIVTFLKFLPNVIYISHNMWRHLFTLWALCIHGTFDRPNMYQFRRRRNMGKGIY